MSERSISEDPVPHVLDEFRGFISIGYAYQPSLRNSKMAGSIPQGSLRTNNQASIYSASLFGRLRTCSLRRVFDR
jgi:hypothetical protein